MSAIELDLHETALRCIAYSENVDADTLRKFAGKVLRREEFTECLALLINAEKHAFSPRTARPNPKTQET